MASSETDLGGPRVAQFSEVENTSVLCQALSGVSQSVGLSLGFSLLCTSLSWIESERKEQSEMFKFP